MQEFFGIDVGGTAVKWAVLGEDFSIRERGSLPTGFTTAEETVSALIGLVEPYRERVNAVGVSAPGGIYEGDVTGTIHRGGALTFMDGCPLGKLMREALGVPVAVNNDGKCCALGEYAAGALRGTRFGVVLAIGTGIGGGIEKVCSIGMPCLFVALLICIIRACTLEGTDVAVQILQADGSLVEGVVNGSALDGLKYMFSPGWAANVGYYVPAKAVVDGVEVSSIMVNGVAQAIVSYQSGAPSIFSVVSTAGGQMFFSLSLGMGAMITYGSYLHKKENLQKNALLIIIMDTMVALMAGLCVMPARFALDPAGNIGGPKLLFITMQNVFHSMGTLGPIFGILFYLLVVFAAISSSISLLEVIVAHFVDKARIEGKGDKRKSYTLIAAACVGLGCILVCADRLGASSFSPAELLNIANPKTWAADWLDFWDALSEGVMMPLGALLMCLMIGWEIGPEFVKEEAEQSGHAMGSYGFFKVCVKFITPLIMVLILYGQIKEFFL